MQLPKLTPLQSRLLAFAIATGLVVVLWIGLQPKYFAYAAEIPVPPEVVQHSEFEVSIPPAPPDDPPIELRNSWEEEENGEALYAPDFAYFDSSLVGRQEDDVKELKNNEMVGMEITPNSTVHFRLKKSELSKRWVLDESSVARELGDTANRSSRLVEGRLEASTEGNLEKRQAQTRLWISGNTCRQPTPTVKLVTEPVPQLTLWVWTSTSSTKAQPSASEKAVGNSTFDGGYVNFTLSTNEDVYIGVSAPALTQGWNGSWHFEVAATTDKGYYHNYDNETNFVFMVDTDSDSTLFITHNLTTSNDTQSVDKWKNITSEGKMPFSIYAFPDDAWSPMMGLERSYCGLKEQFEVSNNLSVATSMTTNFGQGLPKGQFHVQGLETSTKYTGFVALGGTSNMTIDGMTNKGGGSVFKSFQWQTKADDSCQVIFGLSECDTVAYAVPSSTKWKKNDTGLIAFYDGLAASYMKNFSRSLAQVACDTTSTAQYSLARSCADCEADYKAWLCSVLIPRCEDWTATDPWLHPRNINTPFPDGSLPAGDNISMIFNDTVRNRLAYNQSRNTVIDEVIKPGPYKELLPCEDLCFDIVRSCPAQLGFACPNPPMRDLSYRQRDPTGVNLTCNFPGAVVDLNQDRSAAGIVGVRLGTAVLVAVLAGAWSVI